MSKIVFKQIPKFPDYFADSFGNIWSSKSGTLKKMTLHLWKADGYFVVQIGGRKNRYTEKVHRLVCKAFHGEPPKDKNMAIHFNGIRTDNRPENLRWGNNSENMLDRRRHGTHEELKGIKNGRAKLTEADVILIRYIKSNYKTTNEDIALFFNVNASRISNIAHRRSWKHL